VHARPSALVTLPALIIYVAVLNEGVSRDQELEHLRKLPGQDALGADQLNGNFLRLNLPGHTVKWERHTEFTRYSMIQPMPANAMLGALKPALLGAPAVSADWLRSIPGHTVVAIALAMVHGDLANSAELMEKAQTWFGERTVLASQLGNGHSPGGRRLRENAGHCAARHHGHARRPHLAAPAGGRNLPPDGAARFASGQSAGADAEQRREFSG
jgi:uncharacterized membrane-anchored protein